MTCMQTVLHGGVFREGGRVPRCADELQLALTLSSTVDPAESGYRKSWAAGAAAAAVFLEEAILGRKGRDAAMKFSESWEGLKMELLLIQEELISADTQFVPELEP